MSESFVTPERLAKLVSLRRTVVLVALGFLILSMVKRVETLTYVRAAVWCAAALVAAAEATVMQKLGQRAVGAWLRAFVYAAVAALPFLLPPPR